jgi:hypothetical protein
VRTPATSGMPTLSPARRPMGQRLANASANRRRSSLTPTFTPL